MFWKNIFWSIIASDIKLEIWIWTLSQGCYSFTEMHGIGIIIHCHVFLLSQSFVEIAESYLTQLFKLVKGIWIPTHCCDSVYSMGNMVNPFMLHKPPMWWNPAKGLNFGSHKDWRNVTDPPDGPSLCYFKILICKSQLQTESKFQPLCATRSCVCHSVRLYQDCGAWCCPDSPSPQETPPQRRKISLHWTLPFSCS